MLYPLSHWPGQELTLFERKIFQCHQRACSLSCPVTCQGALAPPMLTCPTFSLDAQPTRGLTEAGMD